MATGKRTLLVWGGGGHGRVVATVARAAGWEIAGYADRDPLKLAAFSDAAGARCLISEADLLTELTAPTSGTLWTSVALGIGANGARWEAWLRLRDRAAPALLHPSAIIAADVRVASGSVAMAGVIVNTGAQVGHAVVLNSGCIVEHDCTVSDGAHISPGAVLAGAVVVGPRAWVGANAVVREGIRIGADAVIGAGAVVVRDVPDGARVVGNPARPQSQDS